MRTPDIRRHPSPSPGGLSRATVGVLALLVILSFPIEAAHAGGAYISGDDSDSGGHCGEALCGGMIGHVLRDLYEGCGDLPAGECILAVGANGGLALWALIGDGASLRGWNDPANGGPGACVVHCDSAACILDVDFEDYRLLYVPSDEENTRGGLRQDQLDALNARQLDIQAWVNSGNGRIMALTESGLHRSFGWLPDPLNDAPIQTANADRTPDPLDPSLATIDEQFPGNGSTNANLDHGFYHDMFVGPSGWSGMRILIEAPDLLIADPSVPGAEIPAPLVLGCCRCTLQAEDCSNGIDDDGDGLVDDDDNDCTACGDGVLDPGEECDDDNRFNHDGCDVDCHIEINSPPTCNLPPGYLLSCEDLRAGALFLDGSESADPDRDRIDFLWSSDCATFDDPTIAIPRVVVDGPPPCPVICPVTLTVSDPRGAAASCETILVVADESPPVIACPPSVSVDCNNVPPSSMTTASDDCDAMPTLDFEERRANGPCPDTYTLVRSWVSFDACGNRAECRQAIDVHDDTPPGLSGVPQALRLECGPVPAPAQPSAADDCDPAPLVTFVETRADAACPDAYELTRTWTATDRCGNSTSASQSISVNDTTPPRLVGIPADVTLECGEGPEPAFPTALDDCDPAPRIVLVEARTDGPCGAKVLERRWTATDRCGNSTVQAQLIAISDTTAPVIDEGSGGDACLWPPNHWYACFTTADFHPVVSDACSVPVAWRFVGCASDQPDDSPEAPRRRGDWNGDGHTVNDCVVAPDGQGFCVRSERAGAGAQAQAGRHYGVMAVAIDACGNESRPVSIGAVYVPHDQRPHEGECLDPTRLGQRRGGGRRP